MHPDKPVSSMFARLGGLARSVGTGEVPPAVGALGEHRAAESFAKARKGGGPGRLVGLGVVFTMMAASVAVSSFRLSTTAMSWTVDGSSSSDNRYVSAPSGREAVVRFSEGSEFVVQPRSRLRMVESSSKVVKAVLETGASRVRTSARSGVGWTIDAGPFSVSPGAVATLMVEWLADELLRVSVFEGETSVVGTPSPLWLRAGQQVSANAKNGTVEVGPLSARHEVATVASSPTLELRNEAPEERSPAGERPELGSPPALPSSGTRRPAWSDAVAAGDYAGVLHDAERRGLASVLSTGTLADLVALADAARLSGRVDVGKRALLAQRARFARSGAAKDAAFFLGRMADDNEKAPGSALPWYETYLSEAPNGHFAAEASGRKMVAISRQSGRSAAKESAAEYMRRYPSGPHARIARELLNE